LDDRGDMGVGLGYQHRAAAGLEGRRPGRRRVRRQQAARLRHLFCRWLFLPSHASHRRPLLPGKTKDWSVLKYIFLNFKIQNMIKQQLNFCIKIGV
jgi:hypothetical protein